MLFVRNDPLLLIAAGALRRHADRLIFQSSFPLEETHRNPMKRAVHKRLLTLRARTVDGLIAVSPLGLARTKALFPRAARSLWIPLLSDLPRVNPERDSGSTRNENAPVHFLYVGTHHPSRRLEVVVAAAARSLEAGANASFTFIGGEPEQIAVLVRTPGAEAWVDRKRILFMGRVPRSEIPALLSSGDVGMSLIPPTTINVESSPTKLAEYMGAGLAVLASSGVDLQEEFVTASGAGCLVPFDEVEIADAITSMTRDTARVRLFRCNAASYADDSLQYDQFVTHFLDLVAIEPSENVS